jgi:L-iditol 2-dehydrogenase
MNVIRLHATGDLPFYGEPAPEPEGDEKLLRVKAIGICGSDLRWFSEAREAERREGLKIIIEV